ncbi:MAG: response regulator [Anaeromicrobium sp.]|jgi:YesN/AraC family two-component response regulator|uniref:response regulator n=1 Tax=Anaeromicrobium sp. TaxID=1929132 RepID=UPI0025FF6765|nr:response regulator [Anaeromicrobium sp.]MCT4593883.1 response regulator [Anaeromicrobium sp.]
MKKNTVLFVDDDKHIINSLRRGLIDEKYEQEFAHSGEEALKIMENKKISVIVTDMRMPKMNGLTLLKIISEKYPDIVKLVLSGYTQLPQILTTINQVNIFKFLTKPWNLNEDLIPVIRQSVEYYNMVSEREQMKAEIEKKNELYTKMLKSTNEKFSTMSNDYENIKILNRSIFHYLKTLSSKGNTELFNEHLGFIEELNSRYMNTLPSVKTYFQKEKVVGELNNYISQNYPDSSIKLIEKDENGIDFYGNYRLLITFLILFIKYAKKYYNSLKFTISGKSTEESPKLFFVIELLENQSSEDNFILLVPLFNAFYSMINGKFEIIKNDLDYKILSFKIDF